MPKRLYRARRSQSTLKSAHRESLGSTDTRTLIAACHPRFPSGDSTSVLRQDDGIEQASVVLLSAGFVLTFDLSLGRGRRLASEWFILRDCPIPNSAVEVIAGQSRLAICCRLTFIHRRFAPEWLKLKHLYPELATKEWKHWWAVTEADRLRLRVEIDALCADLYGLDPDDFDWIVRDDPTDPKGFYRVDRQLPFRERLTGLAAAAFRALKEGKWSAESAASLTNDEFFDLLGIPELTNAQAAHAKGCPAR